MDIRNFLILLIFVVTEIHCSGWLGRRYNKIKNKVVKTAKDVVDDITGRRNEESSNDNGATGAIQMAPFIAVPPPSPPSTSAPTTTTTTTTTTTILPSTTTTVSTTTTPITTIASTTTVPITTTTKPDTTTTSSSTTTTFNKTDAQEPMSNVDAFQSFTTSVTANNTNEESDHSESTGSSWRLKVPPDFQWNISLPTFQAEDDISDSLTSENPLTTMAAALSNESMAEGSAARVKVSQLENIVTSPWTILFLLTILVLWCISAIYLLRICLRNKNNLPTSEIVELLPATFNRTFENRAYFYLHEQIPSLQYDRSYEVDRNSVEIGDFIAGGHFGEIYAGTLSTDFQNSRRSSFLEVFPRKKLSVAIKISGNATTPEDIALRKKLLEDELKLMCSVRSHPNVVTLIGAVTADRPEGILILMEKCSAGNLSHFLKSRKNNFIPQFERSRNEENNYSGFTPRRSQRSKARIPVKYKQIDKKANWKPDLSKDISTAHLLSFAMQIAQGMGHLASQNCVHRDLAARNILVKQDGMVKIADFGLAKRIGYTEYYRSQANHELPCRWMSVESLRDRKFSVESDVWSYGILLYELFTLGGIPYPHISNNDVLQEEIANGTQNEQPEYCPDVIYRHMTSCWSINRKKRPTFQESAQLMKTHLSMASEEVLKKVTEEFQRELSRQQQLSNLRSESQKKHRFHK